MWIFAPWPSIHQFAQPLAISWSISITILTSLPHMGEWLAFFLIEKTKISCLWEVYSGVIFSSCTPCWSKIFLRVFSLAALKNLSRYVIVFQVTGWRTRIAVEKEITIWNGFRLEYPKYIQLALLLHYYFSMWRMRLFFPSVITEMVHFPSAFSRRGKLSFVLFVPSVTLNKMLSMGFWSYLVTELLLR